MTNYHETIQNELPTDLSNLNILLVDDDKSHLRVYMESLSSLCRTSFSCNVEDTMLSLQGTKPDLIILDIMLGTQDGFELFNQIKANTRFSNTPIIFLSSMNDVSYKLKAYELGGVDYIEKAAPREEFYYRVRSHLLTIKREQELQECSFIDSLTGIANRRNFDDKFIQSWKRCVRADSQLSVMIVDTDDFSLYNNEYGHLKGDETLRKLAQIMQKMGHRGDDLVARFGGEEFILLLPECTEVGAEYIASCIVEGIEQLGIEHKQSPTSRYVTVSIGIATMRPQVNQSPHEIIQAADDALYQAKQNGKNQYARNTEINTRLTDDMRGQVSH